MAKGDQDLISLNMPVYARSNELLWIEYGKYCDECLMSNEAITLTFKHYCEVIKDTSV